MDDGDWEEPPLFAWDDPLPPAPKLRRPLEPVWTEYKASLIARYLYLFVQVTHHGTYIDGFAGPQYPGRPEHWAARMVLGVELLQHFHLFEIDEAKLRALATLRKEHPGRDVHIYPVDFNAGVKSLLHPKVIPEKQATFCLIDQHTFECEWETLRTIAAYRAEGYKIELFYFLGTGWLDRAVSATKDTERLRRWWGGNDYEAFLRLGATDRAFAFGKRLQQELGYKYALPWAIHERASGGRIMYFMVHAADHPEAMKLMYRAYRNVQPHAPVPEEIQFEGFGDL